MPDPQDDRPGQPPLERRIRQGFPTYQDAERGGQGVQPPRAPLNKDSDLAQKNEDGTPRDRPTGSP